MLHFNVIVFIFFTFLYVYVCILEPKQKKYTFYLADNHIFYKGNICFGKGNISCQILHCRKKEHYHASILFSVFFVSK